MDSLKQDAHTREQSNETRPVFYKIGCLIGHNNYAASSEGKQYQTEEQCRDAIANLIAEQQAPKNAFAVLKFVETEVIPHQ